MRSLPLRGCTVCIPLITFKYITVISIVTTLAPSLISSVSANVNISVSITQSSDKTPYSPASPPPELNILIIIVSTVVGVGAIILFGLVLMLIVIVTIKKKQQRVEHATPTNTTPTNDTPINGTLEYDYVIGTGRNLSYNTTGISESISVMPNASYIRSPHNSFITDLSVSLTATYEYPENPLPYITPA
jgi:hypothetical protein